MLAFLLALSAAAWDTASTSASTVDGGLTVAGRDGSARHIHGGEAAPISRASFTATNSGTADRTLAVRRVEFLTGHDCVQPPGHVKASPAVTGLSTGDAVVPELVVKAGQELSFDVAFEQVGAYYSYCDRFAFRATFQVGDEQLVAVAETNVTRITPARL